LSKLSYFSETVGSLFKGLYLWK